MFKKIGLITLMLLSFLVSVCSAVEVTCLSEKNFIRGKGKPITEVVAFPGVAGPAILKISNGAVDDFYKKVSSAVISINGVDVATPDFFKKKVDYIEVQVDLLEGDNSLAVQLRSKPGGQINVGIYQEIDAEAGAFIGPEGGEVRSASGVHLTVPFNTVSEKTLFKINLLEGNSPITDVIGAKIVSSQYEILSTNTLLGNVFVEIPVNIRKISDPNLLISGPPGLRRGLS